MMRIFHIFLCAGTYKVTRESFTLYTFLWASISVLQVACPSGCPVTTECQFKKRTPPKGFSGVMSISVHCWNERDLAGGVGSVSSGYNSEADFLVYFLFGRFLTLLPVFNVSHVQPIKLFYSFPTVIKVWGWRLHLNQPQLHGSHKFHLVPGNKITLLAIHLSDSFLLYPFKVHTL